MEGMLLKKVSSVEAQVHLRCSTYYHFLVQYGTSLGRQSIFPEGLEQVVLHLSKQKIERQHEESRVALVVWFK